MSEYNLNSQSGCSDDVPIKVNGAFASCSNKDCMSNLKVTFDIGELIVSFVSCKVSSSAKVLAAEEETL